MCGGGFFRDSIILVSGATGTGKTLMVTAFTAGGIAKGERCLTFCFEESREQFFRNAGGWGFDFEELEREGPAQGRHRLSRDHAARGSPDPDEGDHRRVQAEPRRGRQPVGARARRRQAQLPRVRDRADLVHQAPGDGRAVHVDDADAARRHVGHRGAHLDDLRLDHPAALRRDVRRDAARPDGAQDARLGARQGDPRVHDRQRRHAPRQGVPQRHRHHLRATRCSCRFRPRRSSGCARCSTRSEGRGIAAYSSGRRR